MIIHVWVIYKADEPRVYTRTTQPSDGQRSAFAKEGFQVFRAEIDLPVDHGTKVLQGHSTGPVSTPAVELKDAE